MPKFVVSWSELHTASVTVEADSEEDALQMCEDAEYEVDEITLEFTDVVAGTFSVEEA